MSPDDAALEEFKALRAEILAIQQFQNTAFAAAFTAITAIGGFALAKKDGRLELLLVLPIVLSGLGLLQAQAGQETAKIGAYIRDHLWGRLSASQDESRSWEHYLLKERSNGVHGAIARVLIFGVPSVVSLVLTDGHSHDHLSPLWWGDLLVLLASAVLARDYFMASRR